MKKNYLIVLIGIALLAVTVGGCNNLRLKPTEELKQMGNYAHEIARSIDANGMQPNTETSGKMAIATRAVAEYIGYPDNPDIADFKLASEKALADAKKKVTPKDVAIEIIDTADKGLTIAEALVPTLGAIGIGIVTIGGILRKSRKVTDALKEVVKGNEIAKNDGVDMGAAQNTVQSYETKKIVAAIRVDVKKNGIPVSIAVNATKPKAQ